MCTLYWVDNKNGAPTASCLRVLAGLLRSWFSTSHHLTHKTQVVDLQYPDQFNIKTKATDENMVVVDLEHDLDALNIVLGNVSREYGLGRAFCRHVLGHVRSGIPIRQTTKGEIERFNMHMLVYLFATIWGTIINTTKNNDRNVSQQSRHVNSPKADIVVLRGERPMVTRAAYTKKNPQVLGHTALAHHESPRTQLPYSGVRHPDFWLVTCFHGERGAREGGGEGNQSEALGELGNASQ
ncbi:hypothetical protein BDY19DRAFT_1049676 [Irpex rosettiformis]|uniref:Uncharacterized protein n=1 Tax=Irpex rosettiformis TaxID=378272 RepID=A0ACB8TYD1_9APHY|nr:hypothetical protein BDY19DRAFT_1049676 [Irpex rosettiformis]